MAHLYRGGLALRNTHSGHHARDIHHHEERRAGGGHFTGVERPVGDDPADGAQDSRVTELGFERLVVRPGGFHLRGGGLDLFPFGDAVEHPQMLLGGVELGFGLGVAHQGFIHLAPRQGAFLEQTLAAVEHLLGGIHGLPVGVHIGLRLDDGLGNRRAGGGAQVGFRLVHGALAFGGLGGEVAALERGQELALLDVVAAVDVELFDGRGDLRHDAGLVAREQHAIAGDNAADGVLGDGRDLNGRGRLGFGGLLPGAAGQGYQAGGHQEDCGFLHWLKRPRESLKVGHGDTVSHHAVVIRIAGPDQGGLCVHHFEHRDLAGLVA